MTQSVIIDTSEQALTVPWTDEEIDSAERAGVPRLVLTAMFVAAWCRAEFCDLLILDGRLEPHRRYEPSASLEYVLAGAKPLIAKCLGFAIPLRLDPHRRAYAASWPATWAGCIGAEGRN